MNRLTDIYLSNTHSQIVYDPLGRMTSKQADGQTVFSSAQYDFTGLDGQLRPHALSSAQVGSNPFPTQGLGLDYTMFDKVLQITWPSNNSMQFDYGYDHQRIRSVKSMGLNPAEKTYIGNCEKIHALPISDVYRTYLSGPMGVFAVVEQVSNTENITYILKDHLGSWTVFTDEDGDLVKEESFDAWGNRRNAATWTGAATGVLLFDRGFTGHEHMEGIGLINMNGRLYDPVMSTFLSVDNYVQSPDYAQSFNRYAYCLNNPLKYTDPDGELWHIIIGAAIGGIVNLATNANNCKGLWDYVAAFGVGAASGALTAAVPCLGIGNGILNAALQVGASAIGGGLVNGTNNLIAQTGKNFNGINNINKQDLWNSIGYGSISGMAGFAGGAIGASAGNVMINGFNIASPLAKGILGGVSGGAIGGFTGSFVGGGMQTGDWSKACEAGWKGALSGASVGAISGGVASLNYAKKHNLNPFSGKTRYKEQSITIGEGMSSDIDKEWFGIDKISKDLGTSKFHPQTRQAHNLMQENQMWIEMQIQEEVLIFDRGKVGNNSEYYQMERQTIQNMNYNNVHNVKVLYLNRTQTIRVLITRPQP